MKREEIAAIILKHITDEKTELSSFFAKSKTDVGYFYIDNLLPEKLVEKANEVFPSVADLTLKKSLKERKYISSQMNKHNSFLEELLFAFQDIRIVRLIQEICAINPLIEADENLYAGGLSLMNKDCFLNPHLDNSHDLERNRWRALNLLYYVSPNWTTENGGNLELWPDGVKANSVEILSKFNRLVVMETHDASWHSVNKIEVDQERKCISNYYFSKTPLERHKEFHVTSFKGRPNQKLRNLLLTADNRIRMGIRKLFKKGIRKNPHIYKK